MDIRGRHTTAGLMFWTPAPAPASPVSSVVSEVDWGREEEKEEGLEEDEEEDFHSQMDENGIIGLEEALREMGLQGEGEEEREGPWSPGARDPEEGSAGGLGRSGMSPEEGDRLEEHSYDMGELLDSEPLSLSQPPGENSLNLSIYEDGVEVWTEEEELRQEEEEEEQRMMLQRSTELLPVRDRQLDMTEEEEEEEEAGRGWMQEGWEDGGEGGEESQERSPHSAPPPTLGPGQRSAPERVTRRGQPSLLSPPNTVLRPAPRSPSPDTGSTFPHLLHFSSEELADSPGIEAETLPESLPESRCSHAPGSHWLPDSEGEEPTPLPNRETSYRLSGNAVTRVTNDPGAAHRPPRPSPRKQRQRSPQAPPSPQKAPPPATESRRGNSGGDSRARTPGERRSQPSLDAGGDEERRCPLTFPTPDFSKVEPRVHFPKDGYKPPRSKGSPRKTCLPAEPPLVFKSPADIVREVLLNDPGAPAPRGALRGPVSTVPQEFRCPRQATTLMQQLQEDYNRLLTKYAEAENTIDRMRLEAKVNLYSDPPKPSHSIQSAAFQEGSKVMTLTFPRAQRVETSDFAHHSGASPSRPSSSSCSSSSRVRDLPLALALAQSLTRQAGRFLQQVQTYEDLSRRGKLKAADQMKGLSWLAQGLDSLERGYLTARDEHRLLEQRGLETGPFDPDRELEGLIFQCGTRMEELKEQNAQYQPSSEAPPSPPPNPAPLTTPPGASVGAEISSASGESEGGMEDEQAPPPALLRLRALLEKHPLVETDFSALIGHFQDFRELTGLLDRGWREGGPAVGPAGGPGGPAGGLGPPGEAGAGTAPHGGQEGSLGEPTTAHSTRTQAARPRGSQSEPPSPNTHSQSHALPRQSTNGSKGSAARRCAKLQAASVGEGAKLQAGARRAQSQDGVLSPETDSGFVGSESCRLTPAAASPLHQGASVSAFREEIPGKVHPSQEHDGRSRLSTLGQPQSVPSRARGGEGRGGSGSSSSQLWAPQSPQNWPSSGPSRGHSSGASRGASEFGPDSDQGSGEDEGQSYAPPTSRHHYPTSPSTSSPYFHGDLVRARSFCHLTHTNKAIQALQAEMGRLKDRLALCSGQTGLPSAATAPPAAPGEPPHPPSSTRLSRPAQRLEEAVRGGRRGGEEEERGRRGGEEEERAPRPAPRKRVRQRWDLDLTSDSEHAQSTPRPRSSRLIPESPAAQAGRRQHSRGVRSRGAHVRQRVGVSVAVDEPDDSSRTLAGCSLCAPLRHSTPAGPGGGDTEARGPGPHCTVCGTADRHGPALLHPARSFEKDAGHAPQASQPMSQPMSYPHMFLAAPPLPVLGGVPLVQCVPVCSAPVLFLPSPVSEPPSYPHPVYVVQGEGASRGVRGREEARGASGRSVSAGQWSLDRSLDRSLNRAVLAARDMRLVSKRMTRSLATGLHHQRALSQSLHHQRALSQSCTY
ncbi:microtubule organization protein AKNA [Osmerus mordax]|uniref:microtubule organization protein AKNA n=1 Tax=Osmerus mordax TaxID=8014 RepID=UPI00350F4739